jgi:hypothetical protein
MTDHQLVRQWLASSPGAFEAASVQGCFLAAHEASGIPIQVCSFRGELEALGLSIRCLRSGSTDRPAAYCLSLPEVGP